MSTSGLTATNIANAFDVNLIYARQLFQFVGKDSTLEDVQKLINAKPKPFVKWVGGKRQLLRQFRELGLYPPEDFNPITNTYYEPFVGGGAVFFDLLPKNAELSDLNNELLTTYNVIKNNVDELIQSLQKHIYDKEYYLEVRAKKVEDLSDVEVASRFIFLNRTGFNGLYRVNKSGQFNVPFGRYSNPKICDADTIYSDSELLQKVQMINGDFERTEDYITENTFMYFDPPYRPLDATSSFNSYAKEAFNDEEQIRLKEYYDRLSGKGCLLMLSNSDCRGRNPDDTFFDDLYSEYDIQRVFTSRSVSANPSKRGKLSELLIRNYDNIAARESETNININTIYEQRTYKRTV